MIRLLRDDFQNTKTRVGGEMSSKGAKRPGKGRNVQKLNVLGAKCPGGETSWVRNVLSTKRPEGETSRLGAKRPDSLITSVVLCQ